MDNKNYTPIDILDYVIDNEKEADFMMALSLHKYGYSIAEIADASLVWKKDTLCIESEMYKLEQSVNDFDIMVASKSGKYISSFISRFNDIYQLHFLVHECLMDEKASNEDEIAMRVVQYMILKTIKQLRLDSIDKVEKYITNS